MPSISKMDYTIIDGRVKRAVQEHGLQTDSIGLLYVFMEQLFPGVLENSPEVITDGSDDRGIDALHIIESSEDAQIYLIQSKYRDNFASCNRTINDAEILKVSLFLNELFDQAETLNNCSNFKLCQAVKRIWDMHNKGKVCRYHVLVVSNGDGFSNSASNIIASITSSHSVVSFEFVGAAELIQCFHFEGQQRESGQLQVIGKEILERSDGDVRGAIASVDARSFIDLIKTSDGQSIKRHLFDDNLRIFLGVKGGFNSSIIRTATSNDSYLFWYLNNGITITCKNFSYNKGHATPLLNLDSFQIVNGAQTSHSLFEAFREGSENLSNVVLMVRVYATERADIAERVAVATNSQARIQSRDLQANTSVLKKLELAFREEGYFFERKRNMHVEQPPDKRIDALKMGQIILSYDLREPDRAKSESDSIFDNKFDDIFHEKQDAKRLLQLFELYRIIEELRETYSEEHSENVESGLDHQYLVYGHWFVLFTCGLLVAKKFNGQLPDNSKFKELIEDAIALVAKSCSQQKAVAHYQIFRSPRTKDKIFAELSGKQLDFLAFWS